MYDMIVSLENSLFFILVMLILPTSPEFLNVITYCGMIVPDISIDLKSLGLILNLCVKYSTKDSMSLLDNPLSKPSSRRLMVDVFISIFSSFLKHSVNPSCECSSFQDKDSINACLFPAEHFKNCREIGEAHSWTREKEGKSRSFSHSHLHEYVNEWSLCHGRETGECSSKGYRK